ncbi:NtaA/DmoA family FMN-dependent monooxygenase [Plastoroseomonas arctica]|uniref:NtaA/DmoA family FMN-dependent monooxygenase n=1 Tax=Plastoroseomonas arctica TaxID=1509237 RepID=A0AAF1KJD0_9PROT|nr:NtaA/DmoA family FMN-dependent monooxygenase [Plastoroseomonas arctica]MBR0654870.1 NtaA/DmoA family FMN-dependent monooxygenase [Plastoroseomonas arctica]
MPKPFHLAWFLSRGYGPKAWRQEWGGTDAAQARWMMPDLFVDLAQGMERACFDYLIIEDSCNVPYTYKGNHDTYLRYAASTPKMDPAVLVPYLARATKHLGIIPTLSTSEYPPFLLARLVNSLDHTTEGRVGWNIVTGSNDGGAQNYGMDKHFAHDDRYDRADEFADIVTQLWESWDPDAVVLDREGAIFADGQKVRAINYEGQYFKVRGPLSAPRSPQGRPVLCQAGGSPRGQVFAAKWADTIIASLETVADMKAFRQKVHAQARSTGRDPASIKILFLAYPIIDVSMETARQRRDTEIADAGKHIDASLAMLSRISGIDLSKYPLDEPLPVLTSNGHQSSVAKYAGRTPRALALANANKSGIDYTGTVDHVASMMEDIMEEVGGDGFLLFNGDFTRRYIAEICDGLVPELQKRGLTKRRYEHRTFRDNLMAF